MSTTLTTHPPSDLFNQLFSHSEGGGQGNLSDIPPLLTEMHTNQPPTIPSSCLNQYIYFPSFLPASERTTNHRVSAAVPLSSLAVVAMSICRQLLYYYNNLIERPQGHRLSFTFSSLPFLCHPPTLPCAFLLLQSIRDQPIPETQRLEFLRPFFSLQYQNDKGSDEGQ